MKTKCTYCKKVFTKRYKKQRFCSIPCSNRFNLNNKTFFKKPTKYSTELAELFGILLGDGSVTKYYVKIYLNMKADKGYPQNILKIIKIALPRTKPTVHVRSARGTEEIQISSLDVCNYFKSLGFNPKIRYIPKWIKQNENFIKATVRGLFDTEGSIGIKRFKGKKGLYVYKQLTFTNSNKRILKFVESSLEKLGFSPTKNSRKNIYLSNARDIQKYFEIIGTSNPKLEKKLKIK